MKNSSMEGSVVSLLPRSRSKFQCHINEASGLVSGDLLGLIAQAHISRKGHDGATTFRHTDD